MDVTGEEVPEPQEKGSEPVTVKTWELKLQTSQVPAETCDAQTANFGGEGGEMTEGAEVLTVQFEASEDHHPEKCRPSKSESEGEMTQHEPIAELETSPSKSLEARFPHISIIESIEQIKWDENEEEEKKIHCPLCETDKTWDGASRIQRHIKHCHWNHKVPTKLGSQILLCRRQCHRESHFHCPFCGCIKIRNTLMRSHLQQCTGKHRRPEPNPEEFLMAVESHSETDGTSQSLETQGQSLETQGQSLETQGQSLETQGQSLDVLKEQIGAHYHFTMIQRLSDIRVRLCQSPTCCRGKRYHCPMCPVTVYRPNSASRVQKHILTSHWKFRVMYKDMVILKCMSLCADSVNGRPLGSHWHCPHCRRTLNSRKSLTYHLRSHSRGTNYRQRTNEDWAALLGREAAELLWQEGDSDTGLHGSMNGTDQVENTVFGDTEMGADSWEPQVQNPTTTDTPTEVFQTVAALMSQEMLSIIPGSVSVFFSELQEKTSIQYTLTDDWCLIQAKWPTLTHVHGLLEDIRCGARQKDSVSEHSSQQDPQLQENVLSPTVKTENLTTEVILTENVQVSDAPKPCSTTTHKDDENVGQPEPGNKDTSSAATSSPARKVIVGETVSNGGDGLTKSDTEETLSDHHDEGASSSGVCTSDLNLSESDVQRDVRADVFVKTPIKEETQIADNAKISALSTVVSPSKGVLSKNVKNSSPEVICNDPQKMGLRSGRTIKLRDQIRRGGNVGGTCIPGITESETKATRRTVGSKDHTQREGSTSDTTPAPASEDCAGLADSDRISRSQEVCSTKGEQKSSLAPQRESATEKVNLETPVKRGRGRPPKKPKDPVIEAVGKAGSVSSMPKDTSVKRGRGRPPKPKPADMGQKDPGLGKVCQNDSSTSQPVKRKCGRPPKIATQTPVNSGEKASRLSAGEPSFNASPENVKSGQIKKEHAERTSGAENNSEDNLIEQCKDDDRVGRDQSTADIDDEQDMVLAKRRKTVASSVTVELSIDDAQKAAISLAGPETTSLSVKEDLDDNDKDPSVADTMIPVGKNNVSLLSKPVKGLSLARVTKVKVCPSCGRGFRDSHRYHQHLLGTSCLEKARKKRKDFQVPLELESWLSEVRSAVTDRQCPTCKKTFSHILHARMHYSNKTCTTGGRRKDHGLSTNADTGHFQCRHCEFTAVTVNRVLDHESRKHWERNEKCPLCHKSYSSKQLLRQHIKTIHAMGNEKAVCDQCGATVAAHLLKHHLKIKHDPTYVKPKNTRPDKLLKCRECDFTTYKYGQMARHSARSHRTADKSCPHCSSMFFLQSDLKKHIKFTHEGVPIPSAACPQCGKTMFKKNMAAHIKMVHEGRRPHACDVCGRAFLTKYTLQQHMETHKPSEERDTKFLCAFCGKGFQNRTHYSDHLNIHTGARPYVCDICHKTFRCNPALFKHKELHKKLDLNCTICDVSFSARKDLRIHMNQMHEVTPSAAIFKCVCNAEFHNQGALLQHQLTCGQWHQAHPIQSEHTAVSDQDPMAMILQSDKPGTYLVVEDREGEETVMVLQTLNDMEESEMVQAITAGSQVMTVSGSEVMTMEGSEILTISESDTVSTTAIEPPVGPTEQHDEGVSLVEQTEQEAAIQESDGQTSELNRYLCGYCQQLFTGLEDVQAHMLAAHVASDGGEVELALHSTTPAELDVEAIGKGQLSENMANQELVLNASTQAELSLHIPGHGQLHLMESDAAL